MSEFQVQTWIPLLGGFNLHLKIKNPTAIELLSKYKLWFHVTVSRHAWLLTISLQLSSSQPVWFETFEFQIIAQRPQNTEKTGNIDFFSQ